MSDAASNHPTIEQWLVDQEIYYNSYPISGALPDGKGPLFSPNVSGTAFTRSDVQDGTRATLRFHGLRYYFISCVSRGTVGGAFVPSLSIHTRGEYNATGARIAVRQLLEYVEERLPEENRVKGAFLVEIYDSQRITSKNVYPLKSPHPLGHNLERLREDAFSKLMYTLGNDLVCAGIYSMNRMSSHFETKACPVVGVYVRAGTRTDFRNLFAILRSLKDMDPELRGIEVRLIECNAGRLGCTCDTWRVL